MARHKATSGTLASRESYAFLCKQIKAREDLSSCGFKKQGSVQFLENKVVFELGSSRKKVCLRRRLNQFTSWINFMVLFFWSFPIEILADIKDFSNSSERRKYGFSPALIVG